MSAPMRVRSDQDQIRDLIAGHHAAVRDRDAARVISAYVPDAALFDLSPPLKLDAADTKGLEDWFATWAGPIRLEHRDLHIDVDGDIGLAHGFLHMTGRRTDGEETDVWVRHTLGLRRVDGQWRIAHEHTSVPFYMDGSYRAAVDLQP